MKPIKLPIDINGEKPLDQQNSGNSMNSPVNNYVQYQYVPDSNLVNSNVPYTIVGSISPSVIPLDYYSQYNQQQNQISPKPSKKRKHSNKRKHSRKPSKDSDNLVNIAHITITPSQPANSELSRNKLKSPSIPVISQKQVDELEAYFNYLSLYSPNENYQNNPNQKYQYQPFNGANQYGLSQQQQQIPFIPYNQFNSPFNGPFNGQNSYGLQNQGTPNYNNIPNNPPNTFVDQYSPFSYNPSFTFNGNIPPQFNANPSNSFDNGKQFESKTERITVNDKTDESKKEQERKRVPRM